MYKKFVMSGLNYIELKKMSTIKFLNREKFLYDTGVYMLKEDNIFEE